MNFFLAGLVALNILLVNSALAQAEGKPGPHNGYLKKPGPFHTEVIPEAENVFAVHLLDMKFQNSTVNKSKVSAWLMVGKKKSSMVCEVIGISHFLCKPTEKGLQAQQLIVKATRQGVRGNEVVYALPLKR